MNQIKDYLQTQALKLNQDEVAISRAAAQTVLQNGRAHIENRVILHDQLPKKSPAKPKPSNSFSWHSIPPTHAKKPKLP